MDSAATVEPFQGSVGYWPVNPGLCPGLFYFAPSAQQSSDIFRRPSQHRADAALDDWPLDQIGMLDHQRNYLIIAKVFLTQTKFAIDSLARAQKLARLDAQLLDQLAQFLLAQGRDIVIHFLKRDATLTEQLVHFATLRSSGLFVDGDLVFHLIWSAVTCHRFIHLLN